MMIAATKDRWLELVAIEPRLTDLAIDVAMTPLTDPDEYWILWEQHKSRMMELVGWTSSNSLLNSHQDYDVAFDFLLTAYETRWGYGP